MRDRLKQGKKRLKIRKEEWRRAKKILCIRLDSIGDVLMTTPAMRALKESGPRRSITLLTSPGGAKVAPLIPEIDRVMAYDAPWMKATEKRSGSRPDLAMVEKLRSEEFDAAVIFTVFSQNPLPAAFLAYLADIPLRLAHCRENPYQLLTDWVRDPEPEAGIRHEVRRQLDLVGEVGSRTEREQLSLKIPQSKEREISKALDELRLDKGAAWAVIHPGASAASRRYSPASFAEVARQLVTEAGIQIVFTGSRGEIELVEEIRSMAGVPCYSLAGELDLAQLAALLKTAPLLISNNTGPAHIAAAVGTPVVDLYALTNPQHTPWMVPNLVLNHDVPCKFCYKSVCPEKHHHCLSLVSPEQVTQAALELLHQTQDDLMRMEIVG